MTIGLERLESLRVALVSPLFESVPPKLYGGTERVVYHLSEGLARKGHQVTVFASQDSFVPSANLIAGCDQGLRLKGAREEPIAVHLSMFEKVRRLQNEFDVIHFHTEYMHFGSLRSIHKPSLTTMHGRLDLVNYNELFHTFRDVPVVSISQSQRRPQAQMNWVGCVLHGIPVDAIEFQPREGAYLAFLGRIASEKGVKEAIEIARRVEMPLKIAAKINHDDPYYTETIAPLLKSPGVEYVGEIGDHEKSEFLGGAFATLFPIQWPEPFGLVMIESMAAGTPVIAFENGSVQEVIRDGVTGRIVHDVDEAVHAIAQMRGGESFDRRKIREEIERRFSIERMTEDYIRIYREQIAREQYAAGGIH